MKRVQIDPALMHEMILPWQKADHERAFRNSCALTRSHRRHHQPEAAMVEFEDVVNLLREGKIRFVLTGLHGIAGWRSNPRATNDVDVLVTKRDHKKAVRLLHEKYPELQIIETSVVTRFYDPGIKDVVIDVMKPNQEVMRLVFRNTFAVGKKYLIPDVEMALVLKFVAILSPTRISKKRHQDLVDFMDVADYRKDEIDMKKLMRLANRVIPNGGKKIREMVEKAQSNQTMQLPDVE